MSTLLTNRLAIDGGAPVRTRPYPAWPMYDHTELAGLQTALQGGVWANASGPLVQQFEQQFAAFHDARYAIAVPTGTISLEIALRALGIGAGDEVIVPPYTFVATATAVLALNALPIFADIDPETYCLAPDAVEAAITPRTRAVIAVHLGGHPADMDRLRAIGRKHTIAIIEDAAHAHGAQWGDCRVGALGDFGSFSFQASKNMTCGEGGVILTNDDHLAELAVSLHNCGRTKTGLWYEHHSLGNNYRLSEFQSALLLAQLARLPQHMAQREANGRRLDHDLGRIEGLRPLGRDPRCTLHAYHLYLFRYDAAAFGGLTRNDFVAALRAEGIPSSTGYPIPLYQQPLFVNRAFDVRATGYNPHYGPTRFETLALPVCERACQETVWFPQNVLLGDAADMDDILTAIHKIQKAVVR